MNQNQGDDTSSSGGFDFLLGTPRAESDGESASTGGDGNEGSAAPRSRAEAKRARAAAVDSRSLVVPLAITVTAILVVGGAAFGVWSAVQSSEAAVKADSAAFCTNIAQTPGVLEQPAFGWPTQVTDLPTSLEAMREYQSRWQTIAAIAPPTITEDVSAVATAAGLLADNVEATKTIDRPLAIAQMEKVTNATDIRAWYGKYCG